MMIRLRGESFVQSQVIKYLNLKYPKLLYCASAGGMRVSSMYMAKMMKATGYVKGFPDLFIYEPCGSYSGLAIELKKDKKCYATKEQKQWIKSLNNRGYYACVSKGYDETVSIIEKYLSQKL